MANIRSFKELRVWQLAMDLAMDVFEITKSFPAAERYSIVDQIRRSSRSVPSNIVEAWRKRRYPAAFVSKLNDAEGEGTETQTHLEIALRCSYIDGATAQRLDAQYEEVLAMLVAMASHPEQWTVRNVDAEKRKQDVETPRGDGTDAAHAPASSSSSSSSVVVVSPASSASISASSSRLT